ncbi:MAG: hypothetical protein RIT26_2435 [Pseudomonadota bacterium]
MGVPVVDYPEDELDRELKVQEDVPDDCLVPQALNLDEGERVAIALTTFLGCSVLLP